MTVKQLYEILGNYIDVGAGEWDVWFFPRHQFKNRKEHREWLKTKTPPLPESYLNYLVGEVAFAADDELGTKALYLVPSFYIKDENKAYYYFPTEDFLKGKLDPSLGTNLGKRLELVDKASKRVKKKSAKSSKRSKKK